MSVYDLVLEHYKQQVTIIQSDAHFQGKHVYVYLYLSFESLELRVKVY